MCVFFFRFNMYFFFFFFKQKTAYEMRISDWSSDVCSSDLTRPEPMKPCIGLAKRADLIAALAARNGVMKGTHARNWSPYLDSLRRPQHCSKVGDGRPR